MTLANGKGAPCSRRITVSVMTGETGSVSFLVTCNRCMKNLCIFAKYKEKYSKRTRSSYIGLLCWLIAVVTMKHMWMLKMLCNEEAYCILRISSCKRAREINSIQ
jgi:hypothetical protein